MSVEQNEPLATLRRHRDTLSISGLAIIAFGVWDIVKATLSIAFGPAPDAAEQEVNLELQQTIETLADGHEEVYIIIIAFLLLMVFVALALRIYVGLSAHAEARGKRKSWAYVIVAGLMATTSATLMIAGLLMDDDWGNVLATIVTGTIELTSLFAYVDVIRSAAIVKRLTKSQTEGQ